MEYSESGRRLKIYRTKCIIYIVININQHSEVFFLSGRDFNLEVREANFNK